MESFGWSRFFVEVGRVLDSCQNQIGTANQSYTHYIIERLENALRNVDAISERLSIALDPENELEAVEQEVISRYLEMVDELASCIRSLLCYWDTYLDEILSMSTVSRYRASVTHTGNRGRPSFSIEQNQIEYLRYLNFSWTEISDLIGVSRMTIYRRRRDFGILLNPHREVSGEELTGIIQQLRHDNPYCGETMIMGHLRAMDVAVTRERVRSVIRRVDPLNSVLRWGGISTSRRPYSVPGPNSLWHLGESWNLMKMVMLNTESMHLNVSCTCKCYVLPL